MPLVLQGTDKLQRRLRAVGAAFGPMGRSWGDETVDQMRPKVPAPTGKLRRSFHVKSATNRKVVVAANVTAYYIDAGVVPHVIKAKRTGTLAFQAYGRPVFARQVHHRGFRARPFRQRAAEAALDKKVSADVLVRAWNAAA